MTESLGRIKFPKGKQTEYLKDILSRYNLSRLELSRILEINIRTLSDWFMEKSTLSQKKFSNLSRRYAIPFPREAKILNRFWYTKKAGKLGALISNKLYGNPGTPTGRRKGGLISMAKFRDNPLLAVKLGVKIRKSISYPKKSLGLAELIGIVLGDGGITDYQIRITLNRNTDKEYGIFVRNLIKELFGLPSKIIFSKNSLAFDIAVYSKSLVEFLVSLGLIKGNKVKNRIDIPRWIKEKRLLSLRCLRGLMDTDGSFYQYEHSIRNSAYCNHAICFTNHSGNLINSVFDILKTEQFNPIKTPRRVYLYRKKEINRYFKIVGSNNIKHSIKYQKAKNLIV